MVALPGASPTHPAPTRQRLSTAATHTVLGRTHLFEPSLSKFVTPRLEMLSKLLELLERG